MHPSRKLRSLRRLHTFRVPAALALAEPLENRSMFAVSPVPVFTNTPLVSDGSVSAAHTDANLVNPWGIAFNKSDVMWVGDNGTGVSTVYDTAGNLGAPVVTLPPAAGGSTNAAVTGVVFNSGGSKAFRITSGGAVTSPEYLFVSEDGTIAGWGPDNGSTAINVIDNSASAAEYKGVAMTGKGKKARLYAANFHTGAIEIYDSNFQPVTIAGGFTDPTLPAGFAPFNVQTIGNRIYVTYAAKSDPNATDEIDAPGQGVVNVFDTKGRLRQRLATGGNLNAPWAITRGIGHYKNDFLVGNFGDGTISIFDKRGNDLGHAIDNTGNTLVIDGLWGLAYGVHHDKNNLFYTAGPNDEAGGLLGMLTLNKSVSPSSSTPGGNPFPGY